MDKNTKSPTQRGGTAKGLLILIIRSLTCVGDPLGKSAHPGNLSAGAAKNGAFPVVLLSSRILAREASGPSPSEKD